MRNAKRRKPQWSSTPLPAFPVFALLILVLAPLRDVAGEAADVATAIRFGAFWVALLEWSRVRGPREDDTRFVSGLVLGAALAHLGWAVVEAGAVRRDAGLLLEWRTGFAVVFVCLGPLLTAPPRRLRERRRRYLTASLLALPLALATARLGCLVDGCCDGALLPAGIAPMLDVSLLLALRWGTLHLRALRQPAVLAVALVACNLANHALRGLPADAGIGSFIAPFVVAALALLITGPGAGTPLRRRRRALATEGGG